MSWLSKKPAQTLEQEIRDYIHNTEYTFPQLIEIIRSTRGAVQKAAIDRLEKGKRANDQYRRVLVRLAAYKIIYERASTPGAVSNIQLVYQTNELMEELLAFLVYDHEKDMATLQLDKLHGPRQGQFPLMAASQNQSYGLMGPKLVNKRFSPQVVEALNAFVDMNPGKASLLFIERGTVAGLGRSSMPHIIGATDAEPEQMDDEKVFDEQIMAGATAIVRSIEAKHTALEDPRNPQINAAMLRDHGVPSGGGRNIAAALRGLVEMAAKQKADDDTANKLMNQVKLPEVIEQNRGGGGGGAAAALPAVEEEQLNSNAENNNAAVNNHLNVGPVGGVAALNNQLNLGPVGGVAALNNQAAQQNHIAPNNQAALPPMAGKRGTSNSGEEGEGEEGGGKKLKTLGGGTRKYRKSHKKARKTKRRSSRKHK
jgi:hypothetical protein